MDNAGMLDISLPFSHAFFVITHSRCLGRLDLCFLIRTCTWFLRDGDRKIRKPNQTTCWNCEKCKPRSRKKMCKTCRRIWNPEIAQGKAYEIGFPIFALKHAPWTRRPGGIKAYQIRVLRLMCLKYELECHDEINKRFEKRRALGRAIMQMLSTSDNLVLFDLRTYLQPFLL